MAKRATIHAQLRLGPGARYDDIRERAERGLFADGVGQQVADEVMRSGPGSVAEQFAAESEISPRGSSPWPATAPFGRRGMPERTLNMTGRLEAAWLGIGAGSITRLAPNAVTVGVDTQVMPHAAVFQSETPTVVRGRARGAGGRLAMFWYLGMQFGVWISEARLLAGLLIRPRRVSLNDQITGRARVLALDALVGSRGATPVRRAA